MVIKLTEINEPRREIKLISGQQAYNKQDFLEINKNCVLSGLQQENRWSLENMPKENQPQPQKISRTLLYQFNITFPTQKYWSCKSMFNWKKILLP